MADLPHPDLPAIGSRWVQGPFVYEVDSVDSKYVHLSNLRTGGPARMPSHMWPGSWYPAWPPRVGSVWDWMPFDHWTRDPELAFRISNVKGKTVQLFEVQTGQPATVHRSMWPDEFLPVFEPDDRVLRAMVVGGGPGRHLQRLKDKAIDFDVDIDMYIPMGSRRFESPNNWEVPPGIDVVISLVSHSSHGLDAAAKANAIRAHVPFVRVPSAQFDMHLHEALRDVFPDMFPRPWDFGALPTVREDYEAVRRGELDVTEMARRHGLVVVKPIPQGPLHHYDCGAHAQLRLDQLFGRGQWMMSDVEVDWSEARRGDQVIYDGWHTGVVVDPSRQLVESCWGIDGVVFLHEASTAPYSNPRVFRTVARQGPGSTEVIWAPEAPDLWAPETVGAPTDPFITGDSLLSGALSLLPLLLLL